eukprot:1669168-Karenia_brevis.AAC.1
MATNRRANLRAWKPLDTDQETRFRESVVHDILGTASTSIICSNLSKVQDAIITRAKEVRHTTASGQRGRMNSRPA